MNDTQQSSKKKIQNGEPKKTVEWLLNLIGGFSPDELSSSALKEMQSELLMRIQFEQCLIQCEGTTYI